MINVVIVDDEKILMESLKHIIEQDKEIEVVGCAKNGIEAIEMCEQFRPDVVLMDLFMSDSDGIEGARLIKSKFDSIKVLILTAYDGEEHISKAISNGADGYILKDIASDDLIYAIKGVLKGMNIFHKPVFKKVKGKIESIYKKACIEIKLTGREKSILGLVVEGKENKEIAEIIHLSEGTVANLVSGMLKKFNFRNRINLAVFAVKNDLIGAE